MPFGITSASDVLKKWTYKTFGAIPNVYIVADDILIAAKTEAEHESTLIISADGMRPASRALTDTESRYAQIENELLYIVFAAETKTSTSMGATWRCRAIITHWRRSRESRYTMSNDVRVRLHNTWDSAIVNGVCDTPRSYVVTIEDSGSYRRNERVLNKSREVTHVIPPESMERDDRVDDLRTAEPRRAVDSLTDSPAIVRSPLAAEPGTPTTRRGLVSELCRSPSQPRRGSRLKSKPRWQQDFEMSVK